MRMKRSRIRKVYLAKKNVTKDKEGVPTVSYGAPVIFRGEVWPASDKLQVQTYGDRVKNMLNVKICGSYEVLDVEGVTTYKVKDEAKNVIFPLTNGDGVCINQDDVPDYKIVSITAYKPLKLEIEKL